MLKKFKALSPKWQATTIFAILTFVLLIVVLIIEIPKVNAYKAELAKRNNSKTNAEFLSDSTIIDEEKTPYLKSSIDNYYYTADIDGNISFYKFENGSYVKQKASDTVTFALPKAGKVSISMLTVDEETIGYGVYSNKESKDLPFAFVEVIPNNITENYSYLAFVDYGVETYYKNEKHYETAYAFSDNGEVEEIFTIDKETSVIPVNIMRECQNGFYYFIKNDDDTYSLNFKTTISGKEFPFSEKCVLPYAFVKEGYILLLEKPDSFETKGKNTTFCLTITEGMDTNVIMEFEGNPSDYIINGNSIFNPSTKTVYDALGETKQTISTEATFDSVEDFSLQDGGAKIAISGTINGSESKLFFYEFSTDKEVIVGEKDIFLPENSNITALENYVVFLSPAKTAEKIRNIVIPWDKIF